MLYVLISRHVIDPVNKVVHGTAYAVDVSYKRSHTLITESNNSVG